VKDRSKPTTYIFISSDIYDMVRALIQVLGVCESLAVAVI